MSWKIRQGDALERLRELEPESVQTVVTSPPYWGLRDYGTSAWEGGDPDHEHDRIGARGGRGGSGILDKRSADAMPSTLPADACSCGARRIDSQLGLEPTPEQYVANLVEVFREVRRVLRKDGTVWLNLGDSYAGSWGNYGNRPELDGKRLGQREKQTDFMPRGAYRAHRARPPSSHGLPGLKPKDLCGIPWRVAFALQADGWWLRSDVIWAKPNPMPESVTDRPTRAHEYLFLLTKSARYFYDADAIRENFVDERMGNPGLSKAGDNLDRNDGGIANNGAGWERGLELGGRNRRSVWEIATQPYPEAHFATFPPKLVEPCILAGSVTEWWAGPEDPSRAVVLDPFCGSGTTGVVALRHDRSFIGIELNENYCELARNRIRDDAPLLNTGLEVAA